MSGEGGSLLLDFPAPVTRAGFRLERLEVYNWGTFHERVWVLQPRGDNALLTGDIGSGKSTLVDAITTLLVPPQKQAYNKAAGADTRERTLRSYVLGYYKAERGEAGLTARPVALRDAHSYSVVLGCFYNEGFGQRVTLAQVFWMGSLEGQPSRLLVVADAPLSIAEHFAGFGADIASLRKRLRRKEHVELHDTFPPYASSFRRRFGIESDQALELFHQTVSMKSVGNLTDFVREHMLESFAVEPRIAALIAHFDDLTSAHDAVLKAKRQIAALAPLVADCDEHARLFEQVAVLRACRDALSAWFAAQKGELLAARIAHLDEEIERLAEETRAFAARQSAAQGERDELKRAIAEAGGDRIERLKGEIQRAELVKRDRRRRSDQYDALAASVELAAARDADTFVANRRELDRQAEEVATRQAAAQNARTETEVEMRELRRQHTELEAELASLRKRRSNLPARMLAVRAQLCASLEVNEDELPFIGELIQVREDGRDWEGAAERVLHGFALSLLVTDDNYARVAQWVDGTHLGDRLVYYRVREPARAEGTSRTSPSPSSLVRKLGIKPDSSFFGWLEAELGRRFDYACCDTLEQFRREKQAITRNGQLKSGGDRHEKDDRHALGDRSRYVLGWSNEAKIATLEKQRADLARRVQKCADRLAAAILELGALGERSNRLAQLGVFKDFAELDWRPLVLEIERLDEERRQLEESSDQLRTLEGQLRSLEARIAETQAGLDKVNREHSLAANNRERAQDDAVDCAALLASLPEPERALRFPHLEGMRVEVLGRRALMVENCAPREREMRDWLQRKIDADNARLARLGENVVQAMQAYCKDHPLDTREVDVSVEAAAEYRKMLAQLSGDDLPRFEGRFKELLNENTIREVAGFQSQLQREKQSIRERIDRINQSLRAIDYNPNRYILLEAALTADAEVRDFQQDLRGCTEGTLSAGDDAAYSEEKFLQVKRLIERLGARREGTVELDRRWTRKVTDVRHWFVFSASERWREDDREHEHYADSGGKSGGQKEKLAYTVLAASLAYQFGLEWGAARSRTFRFVVIDEAFGRGSDESARYALELFRRLNLQLLIVTPLQKIHIIEPFVSAVGFVHNDDGKASMLRNLTIEEYRAERDARIA